MIQITRPTIDKIPYVMQVADSINTDGYTLIIDITGGYKEAFVPSAKYTYTFDTDNLRKDIEDYVQATIPTTTAPNSGA